MRLSVFIGKPVLTVYTQPVVVTLPSFGTLCAALPWLDFSSGPNDFLKIVITAIDDKRFSLFISINRLPLFFGSLLKLYRPCKESPNQHFSKFRWWPLVARQWKTKMERVSVMKQLKHKQLDRLTSLISASLMMQKEKMKKVKFFQKWISLSGILITSKPTC